MISPKSVDYAIWSNDINKPKYTLWREKIRIFVNYIREVQVTMTNLWTTLVLYPSSYREINKRPICMDFPTPLWQTCCNTPYSSSRVYILFQRHTWLNTLFIRLLRKVYSRRSVRLVTKVPLLSVILITCNPRIRDVWGPPYRIFFHSASQACCTSTMAASVHVYK